MQLYGGRQLTTTCFGHSGDHHQVVHSLREKLSTICKNKPKKPKTKNPQKTKNKNQKQKTENYDVDILVFCFLFLFLVFWLWFFGFFGFCFWFFVCFFVFCFLFLFFWFVVAYCTQHLSQAMFNLMMATTMAETCSCQLPSTIQLHNNNNIVVFEYFIHSLYTIEKGLRNTYWCWNGQQDITGSYLGILACDAVQFGGWAQFSRMTALTLYSLQKSLLL